MNYTEDFNFIINRISYSFSKNDFFKNLQIDFYDIEEDMSVSYLPNNKLDYVKSEKLNPYDNNYRRTKRFGSLVKYAFPNFSESYIEYLVLNFKTEFKRLKKLFHLEVVHGEDIRYWYNGKNNIQHGKLGNSCMKYMSCQKKLDIFVNNPHVCKMLILKESKEDIKITGRSLLWKTNKGWYMDRIYTSYDEDELIFNNYAKVHNMFTYNNNDEWSKNLYVKVQKRINPKRKDYPYMDTFKYYFYINGIIANYNYHKIYPSIKLSYH